MRIDEKIEQYLNEASVISEEMKWEISYTNRDYKTIKKIITGSEEKARAYVKKLEKADDADKYGNIRGKISMKSLNEASTPSKDEIAYVVGDAKGYYVYGSKEQAEKNQTKYALKPKKSLGKALFAANDEQGYTHYCTGTETNSENFKWNWTEVKRIPKAFLDPDRYMVEAEEHQPIPIHKGDVFKSLDKSGDFAGEIMYAARVDFGKGKVYVVFKDGAQEWMSIRELNIDKKSIRKYNSETDPDFIGMMG